MKESETFVAGEDGVEFSVKVFEIAKRHNVFLKINAQPPRMDLNLKLLEIVVVDEILIM